MTDEDVRSRTMPADGTTVNGRTICAYAAVFNRRAEIRDRDGHYIEVIDPGAFAEGIAARRHQIFSIYNHGRNIDYSPSAEHSVPYGTPDPDAMREDHRGWYTETRVNEGPEGDRLLAAARNKALKGMSFTGVFLRSSPPKPPGGYQPDAYGNLTEVHRQKILPIEYGLTPIPAYKEAEVVGVRNQGRADATTSGPSAYIKEADDTIQCPACLLFNDGQAEFCDQCGASLPGFGSEIAEDRTGDTVGCPNCGTGNQPDARFCDQCGKLLPHSSYEGALAAAGAKATQPKPAPGGDQKGAASTPTGATSSSGRQPAGTERAMADVTGPDGAENTPVSDTPQGQPGHGPAIGRHVHVHGAAGGPDSDGDGFHQHEHSHYNDAAHDHAHHTTYDGRAHPVQIVAERFDVALADVEAMDPRDVVRLAQVDDKAKYTAADHKMVRDAVGAARHSHGHQAEGDDSDSKSKSSTSSSGRNPESQGAASRGTAEPHARSASSDRAQEGAAVVSENPNMTMDERAARQAEISRRLEELNTEFSGATLPGDRQKEWDELVAEDAMHEKAIAAQTSRTQYLMAKSSRQGGGQPGYDVDSGYGRQAAQDNDHAEVPAQSRSQYGGFQGLVPSSRQLDRDIWDMSTVRTYARSIDDMPDLYRERARRVLDFARFPGVEGQARAVWQGKTTREDVQTSVERLLHRPDDPNGFVAQRMLSTGSPIYQRAFGKILAHGPEMLSSEEQAAVQRALTIGTPASFGPGSFPVPYQVDPTVIITSNGVINAIRQIARVEQIVGREWLGVTSNSVVVTRQPENTATTDGSPTLAQPGVAATRVQAFIPFSIEVEQDWNGLLAEISVLLADGKDIEEAGSFLTGNGTSPNPQGILTGIAGAPQQVLTATTAVTAIADIYNVETQMAPRFRAQSSFLASKGGYNVLRQLWTQVASAAGDPWVRPSAGTPAEFVNYPAYENSNMATSATTSGNQVLIQGDWKQYLIVDRVGMSIELVPHVFNTQSAPGLGFPVGQRGVYAMWRNNALTLVPNAFRYLQVR